MFGLGFGEISVIVVLGIVLLGPEEAARLVREAKKILRQILSVKKDIESDL